ncbi:MAG: copper chaperone PCu(A)C [Roseibium sp.]
MFKKHLVLLALAMAIFQSFGFTISNAESDAANANQSGQGLVVETAWSPASAPGMNTSALYFSLTNIGCLTAVLETVESPGFRHAHLHKSSLSDGITTMESVAQVEISAGQTAYFKPGGLHVMLMGATRSFEIGDQFKVSLNFQDGRKIAVTAKVTAPGAVMMSDGGSKHQHDHDLSPMSMN